MKKISIILLITTLLSCTDADEIEDLYYDLYAGLEFSIINDQGEDLLNPENPNHLNTDDIWLYYVIDGESQIVYNTMYNYPRNFLVFKHENEFRIGITLNHTDTSEKPITYIKWNDSDTDTVEVTYTRTQHSLTQNKIWLNGELIWEIGDGTIDPYFVLTK